MLFDGSAVLPLLLGYFAPSRSSGGLNTRGKSKLPQVNGMLSSLLGESVKVIPVPAEKDIHLKFAKHTTSLKSLGTGYEQLLIIATALVEYPSHLLLIEEPELFLHPTLQRRLLQRLLEREQPSVITTHSNHLLDIRDERVAYYRTYVKQNGSGIERINTHRKYSSIWDLGVRPSSLFESNAAIWVEGPTDAIYLRAWLSLLPEAEGLVEGIHYTFAFHSGALLDKFFVNFEDVGAPAGSPGIVNFLDLHPNFYLIADSDGDADGSLGHEYLQRLVQAVGSKAPVWVTAGKEIENYLPQALFVKYLTNRANPRRAIVNQAGDANTLQWKPFWQIFNALCQDENAYQQYPDKMKFAAWAAEEIRRSATEGSADQVLGMLDLKANLLHLTDFIRSRSRD